MWVLCAAILGSAVVVTALNGGVARLVEYFQQTTFLSGSWATLVASGLVALQTAGACCLVWARMRRIGWILVGALGGACAPFHAFALIVGDVPPCPCLGTDLVMAGARTHAVVGAVCLGLLAGAFIGVRAPRRPGRLVPAGGTT